MKCTECELEFDGFQRRMHRNGHCQPCYNKKWAEGKFTRPKIWNCGDCGVEFNESNISNHTSRCKKCYSIWQKAKRVGADLCCGCKKPNPTKGDYCKLCRKAAAGKFTVNIPPTKVTMGRVTIPDDLKSEIGMLIVRHKNKLFNSVDYYLAAHLYLTIFVWDAELDSYAVDSQVEYMIRVLRNLIRQS